jgi:hypothetical protein
MAHTVLMEIVIDTGDLVRARDVSERLSGLVAGDPWVVRIGIHTPLPYEPRTVETWAPDDMKVKGRLLVEEPIE